MFKFRQKLLAISHSLTRKLLIGLIAFVIIGSPIMYLFLINAKDTKAAWYDDNWGYRQAITLTLSSASADITNADALLTVDTATPVAAGKMQSSCQDLRFTTATGKLIPYYIAASCNNASTKIYLLLDLVPKNTTTMTVDMYYGNPNAQATSDSTIFQKVASLAGYWNMNESGTGTRADSTTNNNTLTNNNTANSTTGQVNNAVQLTLASNQFLSHTSNSTLQTGNVDFTLASWVYMDSAPGQAGIICKFTSGSREYCLDEAGSTFRMFVGNGAGGASGKAFGSSSSTGAWHFVVGYYQSSGTVIGISVDGAAFATATSSVTPATTSDIFMIGRDDSNGAPWNGRVDESRLYKKVLTLTEVNLLYGTSNQAYATEEVAPGPVAYWKFDEGTGTTANDSTINTNSGTLGGATKPTWQTEDQCISVKCLYFDGASSKVTGSKAAIGVKTVSFWIRPNTIASQGLISLNDASSRTINTNSSGVIAANNFTSPTYYINGVATTTPTLTLNQWSFVEITTGTGVNSGTAITIGTDGTNFQKGFFDEVKFYSYARSAAQILADYNSRGSVKGASIDLSNNYLNNPSALNNGLVGYWKTDETSGNAVDTSGNGNTLTNNNTVTYTTGKFGNAANFVSASSQYLSIADNTTLSMNGTDFSGSAWVYIDTLPSSDTRKGIVTKWINGTPSKQEYRLILDNTGGTNRFKFSIRSADDTTNTTVSADTFGTPATGTWYFVKYYYNNSNGQLGIGVNNGAFDTTINNAGASGGVADGTAAFTIGAESDPSRYFDGRIDETRLYKRLLSSNDFNNLYNFSTGPVAQWKMDENLGTTTADSSGYANNSSAFSGNTAWGKGIYGSALTFDGDGDVARFVETSSTDLGVTTDSYTVSGFMKTTTDYSGNAAVVAKDSGTGTYPYSLYLDSSEHACFQISDGTNAPSACGSTALNDGKWHYLTGVRDVAADKVYIYVDNVQINSATDTTTATAANNDDESIGNSGTSYTTNDFNGTIDNVSIYNYVRSSAQMTSDLNALHPSVGSPLGSPLGYWKFDEGYATTAYNSGSSAYTSTPLNGNLTNMASPASFTSGWTADGKFGKALNFDGSNDFVAMPSDVAPLKITGAVTLSAWINLTSTAAQKDIISKWTNTAGTSSYILYTDSSGKLNMGISDGSTITTTTGNTALARNTWYHVVGVYNPSTSVTLYINGRQDKQNTTTIPASLNNSTTVFDIGAENAGTNPFSGIIDEPKIYSGALSASQVLVDMNRASSQVLGATSTQNNNIAGNFNGTTDFLYRLDESAVRPGTSHFFVTAWVYETLGSSSTGRILAEWNNNVGQRFRLDKTSNSRLEFIASASGGGGGDAAATTANGTFTANTWHFVAGWYNATNNTLNASIDNGTVASVAFTGPIYNTAAAGLSLSIGSQTSLSGITVVAPFQGYIQSSGGWKGILPTAADLTYLYNSGRTMQWSDMTAAYQSNFATWGFWNLSEKSGSRADFSGNGLTLTDGSGSTFSTQGNANNIITGNQSSSGQFCIPGDNTYCNNPVADWKMDENAGTTTNDSSGNGNVSSAFTGNTAWGKGKYGSGLIFDGTDDVAQFVETSSTDLGATTNSYTVSSFMKTTTDYSGNAAVVAKDSGTGTYPYSLYLDSSEHACFQISDGTNTPSTCSATALNDGKWHYLTGVRSVSADTLYIYVDGALANSTNDTTTATAANNSDVSIGNSGTSYTANDFNGTIDAARIYNYVRTQAQIDWDYNNGASVAWYKFDECQGTQNYDSSTNANGNTNGHTATTTIGGSGSQTVVGTCLTPTDGTGAWYDGRTGKFNSSLNFDGTDDYDSTAAFSPLAIAGVNTKAISWGGWFYPTTSAASKTLMEKSTEFHITTDSSSKPICGIYYSAAFHDSSAPTPTLTLNAWNNVLCTYDGTNINTYLNGVLIKQSSETNNVAAASSAFYMGASSTPNQYFTGQIDAVQIYNYPLTANQIQSIYNQGGATRFGPLTGSP